MAFAGTCVLEGEGLERATTADGGEVLLTAMTRDGKRVSTGGDRVEAVVRTSYARGNDGGCCGGGPVAVPPPTSAKVTDHGDGTYLIKYPTPVEGSHTVEIAVNGTPVPNSPFHVAVEVVLAPTTALTGGAGGASYYDNQGMFYWLATERRTRPWQNPAKEGKVEVTFSSLDPALLKAGTRRSDAMDKAVAQHLVANTAPTSSMLLSTADEPNSWMAVFMPMGPNYSVGNHVRPTGYVLSVDAEGLRGNGLLRNWKFQGSYYGTGWVTLRTHTNDTTLSPSCPSAFWPVDMAPLSASADDADSKTKSTAASTGYRTRRPFCYFRLLMTGPNSSGDHRLRVVSLEVYGELVQMHD
jgi:hypothetical protein